MPKHSKIISLIILYSLLAGGCAGIYGLVEFEILEPATVEIPEDAGNFLVLNRASSGPSTWSPKNRKGLKEEHYHLLDTLIVNSIRKGISQELELSPMNEHFIRPAFISERLGDSIQQAPPLNDSEVAHLCSKYDYDFILSLESFYTKLDEEKLYSPYGHPLITHYYYISNQLKWNIYVPGEHGIYNTFTSQDTMYFSVVIDGEYIGDHQGIDMIREIYTNSGARCSASLVPVWSPAERLIYKKGNKELRDAAKLTQEGDWDQAFASWEHLSVSNDSTASAMALHNMAVYYELEDKLDSCQICLEKAMSRKPDLGLTLTYLEDIEVRILNRVDIIKQIQ